MGSGRLTLVVMTLNKQLTPPVCVNRMTRKVVSIKEEFCTNGWADLINSLLRFLPLLEYFMWLI